MNATAIVLNDWNDACPELIHPQSRNREAGAYYYAFNTAEEEGCRRIVKNAHRFLKFGRIKPEVHRIHIVPGLMLVDLVGDHPVGYNDD